jgi:dTDP-4-amino-4,6-dideoxygalactose transaminase
MGFDYTRAISVGKLEPWRTSYLVFGAPAIGPEERAELLGCLDERWLGSGPRVSRFENDFRDYVGTPAAVAVSSCSAALHLALLQLGLEPGDEVLTSPMTFCATAHAIVHAGLTPVFVDCDATMNLDANAAAERVGPRTRAILPVHFAGRPCDMGAIVSLAATHGLAVVEDCAHAIEATIDGRHCGTFGEFGCFSFYVTKNVMTVDGGMITCRDAAEAGALKSMALHGMNANAWERYSDAGFTHYDVDAPGFKYNLTDLAAAFGIHQLARVERNWRRRRELWDYYLDELRDLPLVLPPPVAPNVRHAFHLFSCLIDAGRTPLRRDEVLAGLHALRIGAGVHYRPVHLHAYYRRTYGYREGDFPVAEAIGERTFSIPLSAAVTDEDAADVVRALHLLFEV